MRNPSCHKCGVVMVQGFIPDFSYGAVLVGGWHPGEASKSFWHRTKTSMSDIIPIGAFRCPSCGLLELYADPRFKAQ